VGVDLGVAVAVEGALEEEEVVAERTRDPLKTKPAKQMAGAFSVGRTATSR